MSLKNVTVTIDVLPAVVPLMAGYLQSEASLDPEIKESGECEVYSCTTSVDFAETCSEFDANHLRSRIRRYGDLFAAFADFLTATSSFLSAACIAEFLTTVFQPFRYEVVQAYGRLVHFHRYENRPAAGRCLRELVSTKLKRILRQRMNFVGGVMRIRHPQEQQPLFKMAYGSSWYWNYRSFRMITSRPLAATRDDMQTATMVA